MPSDFMRIVSPELVIGIAGPIGVDIDALSESIDTAFSEVGYITHLIKITDEIKDITSSVEAPKSESFSEQMTYKMDHASALCREQDDPSLLMRYAVKALQRERANSPAPKLPLLDIKPITATGVNELISRYNEAKDSEKSYEVRYKAAYVIRQIKRPEEVELLRTIYGRQFILVSAYGTEQDRRDRLTKKIKDSLPVSTKKVEIMHQVEDLLMRDMHEGSDKFGQHMRDSYHLADVFVDGISKAEMDKGLKRFVRAFFGAADVGPTKAEFGLYMASAAALRSSDMSRQIGAAALSDNGEILSQGCNEVPKAFGGTYWDTEEPDHRDVKIGYDPNDRKKSEVLRDLLERFAEKGLLSAKALGLGGDVSNLADVLTSKEVDDTGKGALKGSSILDLTEFGRVVHAEMNAILEAGRLGTSLVGSTLYTTTFPCHNCTKHVISAGIKKVVYLEPYPKSMARELHEHELSIEEEVTGKVSFFPFQGIAPAMFRYVFARRKRKKNGEALRWVDQDNGPTPMVNVMLPSYILFEGAAVQKLN